MAYNISSFHYEIPTNKSQLIYDFYFSTLLNFTNHVCLDFVLSETKRKIYTNLREELLLALFFSITSEFRHAFDFTTTLSRPRGEGIIEIKEFRKALELYPKNKRKHINEYIKRFTTEKLEKQKFRKLSSREKELFLDGFTFADEYYDQMKSYRIINRIFRRKGLSISQFVQLAQEIFNLLVWDNSYGGELWAKAAHAWNRLYTSKIESEMIVAIDHIFDLQHHTNLILDKVPRYKGEGDEELFWLKRILDRKAKFINPYEFFPHISPQLKRFSTYIIKINYGQTLEEFTY